MERSESARSRMLASLTGDVGRTLARGRERAWTLGDVLGAAETLRAIFSQGEGPLGVAFSQPGWIVAALLAAWSTGRVPIVFDPGLRRESEVLRRLHPGIRIYADTRPSGDGREQMADLLAASIACTQIPAWLRLPKDDEPFASLLTSASTGDNKVIEKRGFQLYGQAEALALEVPLRAGARVLSFVPSFHLLGFFYGLVLPLVHGAETVVATDLAGLPMVELIAKYQPELVVGTATHYRFLVRAADRIEMDPSFVHFLSSGAPLDPAVAEEFSARFGTSVRDFYGTTELGGVAFRSWPGHYRSMPGVRWRIDAESGALEVMSPWGGGSRGEWVSTGDAAELVGDEGFRLLGRLDHVVKVGGKRFSTVEVEQALRAMPHVAEAAVVTFVRFGEPALAAAVVTETHTSPNEAAVRGFLAEHLASFKLPRSILFLPALPKASHGKVDYRALRALLVDAGLEMGS